MWSDLGGKQNEVAMSHWGSIGRDSDLGPDKKCDPTKRWEEHRKRFWRTTNTVALRCTSLKVMIN